MVPLVEKPKEVSPLKAFLNKMVVAYKTAWQFLFSISMVFLITFVLFPPVITDTDIGFLAGIKNDSLRISWTILIFIFIFNLFDTIGRWLAGQTFGGLSDKAILALTYLRVVFIATSYLIDYEVGPTWFMRSDWFKLINMALFAFTNGYCSTQCAVKSVVRAPEHLKEVVGTYIGISITIGIVGGSLIALGT